MIWDKEIALGIASIPFFNILKYFFATLLFGSILDLASENADSMLAKNELLTKGWTRIQRKRAPRVTRAGIVTELSIRSTAALLIIFLALSSDILDELAYDAKEVSIKTETSPPSYIIVRNGSVTNHALLSTIKELSLSHGIKCLGPLQGGLYSDQAIHISDDGNVDIHGNKKGFRRHFNMQCGYSVDHSNQAYPIAVKRNDGEVDAWLSKTSAIRQDQSQHPLKLKFSGAVRVQRVKRVEQTQQFDGFYSSQDTDLLRIGFPERAMFCVSSPNILRTKTFTPICWNGRSHVYSLWFDLKNDTDYKKLIANDGMTFKKVHFDGYQIVGGITSMSSFLSFSTLYTSYGLREGLSHMSILFTSRLATLSMKYSHEYAGKQVTSQKAIRPIIRLAFFIPSLIIVILAGVTAAILAFTKRTIPLLKPEYIAGAWQCCDARHKFENQSSFPENVFLVVTENETSEEPSLHVTVTTDITQTKKPDAFSPILGISRHTYMSKDHETSSSQSADV